jgi:flagellar hook-length control protein FliK
MSSLPITPPKARVDPAPSRSAGPPGGSSGEDFAALLSQTTNQARTAPAEGRNTRPAQSRRDDDARAQRSQHDDDAKTDATSSKAADDATPTPSQTTSKDATDPNAGRNGDQQDGQDPNAQEQQGNGNPDANAAASTAAAVAAGAAAAAKQATPVVRTGTVVADGGVTGQSAQPQQAVTAADVAAQAALVAATDAKAPVAGDGTPAGRLQLPAELLDAKGAGKHAAKGIKNVAGAVADGLPPAPTLPPSAAGAAAAQTGAGAGQPGAGNNPNNGANAQAQPATPPAVAVAQPTATPLTAVPTANGMPQLTKGSVVQTAARVEELVRIATTRAGNARATLQLRPEALGQVDVQLRTTKDGLVATIAAHDQAGLDALQNAAGELKRTLEDRGVQLHSLDLQLGAGADSGFSNQGDARQASSGPGGRSASYGLDGEDADDELELTISRTPSVQLGELVDVTA